MKLDAVARAACSLLSLLELFAPPRCRVCGIALLGHANPFLCPACVAAMRWIGSGACRRCGFPAGEYAAWGDSGCVRCRGRLSGLSGVAAVARYSGGARELVRALKFHGERRLVPVMGGLMADRWAAAGLTSGAGGVDLVVPVALHSRRRRARGFDQSALLAEVIASRLGVEFGGGTLRRVKFTRPQAFLRRADRLLTMQGVFVAEEASVRGRVVLLVDDVFTTGSTMRAAAGACRKAGAKKVYGIAFAR